MLCTQRQQSIHPVTAVVVHKYIRSTWYLWYQFVCNIRVVFDRSCSCADSLESEVCSPQCHGGRHYLLHECHTQVPGAYVYTWFRISVRVHRTLYSYQQGKNIGTTAPSYPSFSRVPSEFPLLRARRRYRFCRTSMMTAWARR